MREKRRTGTDYQTIRGAARDGRYDIINIYLRTQICADPLGLQLNEYNGVVALSRCHQVAPAEPELVRSEISVAGILIASIIFTTTHTLLLLLLQSCLFIADVLIYIE